MATDATLFSEDELSPWRRHWTLMPEYEHHDLGAEFELRVKCRTIEDLEEARRLLTGQSVTLSREPRYIPSIIFPPDEIGSFAGKLYVGNGRPRYPIYIPSKGRADYAYTMRTFDNLDVPYLVFIEREDYVAYRRRFSEQQLHVLPFSGKGLCATRNYIWDFAEKAGTERFWTFDDNIEGLFYYNDNLKVPCDATALAVIEDFADRYKNVAIAGMHYFMFVNRKEPPPPLKWNTRVYSNMLIDLSARDRDGRPFRNELFFNDDTDLCLRVLKSGLCTVLFSAFLICKRVTMSTPGGMTDYYNETDERREFTDELVRAHPDVAQATRRWGRVHHYVDYSGFRQQPIFRDGWQERARKYQLTLTGAREVG